MKTTKTNHSEAVKSIKAQLGVLVVKRDSYRDAWLRTHDTDKAYSHECYEAFKKVAAEMDDLTRELDFHKIMLQEKKYATLHLWSDAHAYEIIEEKNDKVILVRQLKATIKKDAQKALHDSFVPGGFCGHFDNDLQEWDFASDESNPIETIRKHKDGRWYGLGKARFTIEAEPYERFDYNF